jgi:hypothetical protein
MKQLRRILRLAVACGVIAAVAWTPLQASALTTGHTGSGGPALAESGGRLYVGWTGSTGTAGAKGLNLGYSTNAGKTITKIANGETAPQGVGPALDGDGTGVYLAWPSGNASDTLTAAYFNGTAFTCRTSFTGVTTTYSPALADDGSGNLYIAWTDPVGHIEIARLDSSACATTGTMALTGRTTLTETTTAGPALVYDTTDANLGLVVAWTSSGSGSPVEIGSYTGATTLTNLSQVSAPVGSSADPGLAVTTSDLYLMYPGTDGYAYLGYSEGCIPSCFSPTSTGNQASSSIGIAVDGATTYYAFFDPTGHLDVDSF